MADKKRTDLIVACALLEILCEAIQMFRDRLQKAPMDHPEIQDMVCQGIVKLVDAIFKHAGKPEGVKALTRPLQDHVEELRKRCPNLGTWEANSAFMEYAVAFRDELVASLKEEDKEEVLRTAIRICSYDTVQQVFDALKEDSA